MAEENVTREKGRARCPECGRIIGSPKDPSLAVQVDPGPFPPRDIECPECGEVMRLSWRMRMTTEFTAAPRDG